MRFAAAWKPESSLPVWCLQVSADQHNHLQYEREADKRKWQGELQQRDTEIQSLQSELQRLASELGQRWVCHIICLALRAQQCAACLHFELLTC